MSRALHLDFVAKPARPWWAWLVLMLGAMLLAQAATHYADVMDESERMESQLSRLQRQLKSTQPQRGRSGEQLARNDAQQREQKMLTESERHDWREILQAVEAAVDKDVALLAVNHENSSKRLRIAAEARTMDEALRFVARLRSSKRFTEVMLSGHENRKSTDIEVLGFTVLAGWK